MVCGLSSFLLSQGRARNFHKPGTKVRAKRTSHSDLSPAMEILNPRACLQHKEEVQTMSAVQHQ